VLLEVKDVSIQFGGLKVIEGMNLSIRSGELVGLIGPNGAGKTTAFNLISGIYKPTRGEIFFDGEPIHHLKAYETARRGIVRTFQNIRLFPTLTVKQNILIGMHKACPYNLWSAFLRGPKFFQSERESETEALRLLDIFQLRERAEDLAGDLPYGVQRKIEIVRALAGRPSLLLLDEPAAGMNHSETDGLMKLIAHIRQEFKLAVLLIEHDMKLVMGICERIVVLDHGVIIAKGSPQEIQNHPKVIEAYLGLAEEPA